MANPLIAVFNPITTLIDPTPSASSSSTPTSLQAFAPVVLNSNGIIDPSLVPNQGTVNNIEAGQPISSGQLVSLYYVSTQLTAELAWAGATGTAPSGGSYPIAAVGFAVTSANPPSFTTVQVSGLFTYFDNNAEFSASNIGDEVFLRWQTSGYGGITLTRPAPPNLQQTVGTVVGFTAPNVVQVAFVPTPNPPELNFSNISSGTNTSATMTLGSGASLTFSGSGVVNANELTGNPVSATTPTTGQALIWSGSAWAPSSTFSTSFTNLTTGTNTTAGMTVGSGSSLTFSGSGVINVNTLYGVTISATPPTTGQVLTATSASTADWETPSGGGGTPGGSPTQIQFNNTGVFGGIPGSTADGTNGLMALAPTGTGVALTVQGDQIGSDILDLQANDTTLVFGVDGFGSVHISPETGDTFPALTVQGQTAGTAAFFAISGGTLTVDNTARLIISPTPGTGACLQVFGDGGGTADIADFIYAAVPYNVVAISQPNNADYAAAVVITPDASGNGVLASTDSAGDQFQINLTPGFSYVEISDVSGASVGSQVGTGSADFSLGYNGNEVSADVAVSTGSRIRMTDQATSSEVLVLQSLNGVASAYLASTTTGLTPFITLEAPTTSNVITIQPSLTQSVWTWTLPPNAGSAGYTLQTDGTGVTSWSGGVVSGIVTKTGTYTAAATDHTINCNGTFTLTLPTTLISVGQEFYIKNIGTGVSQCLRRSTSTEP